MYGLFLNPRGFKWLLFRLSKIRFLKKWKRSIMQTGVEVALASEELKGYNIIYWLKASLSTLFVWVARYAMLNCLVAAFMGLSFLDHMMVFGRQIALWIVMLISPTPGSSGAAEGIFPAFYGEFLGDSLSVTVAIFWRLFYYYPYLFAGLIVLQPWLKRIYQKDLKS